MTAIEYIKSKYDINGTSPVTLHHFGRKAQVLEMFQKCGLMVGVEIGTDTGRYAKDVFERLPDLKLFCIDPWLSYTEGEEVKTQEDAERIYQEATERLSKFNCELIRKTSMDAVKDFEDNSLDFVFIDGNHEYEYVLEDITEWTKKVKTGGVIYGHDYVANEERKYGIIEAVQKYTSDNKINPWFVLHVPAREGKASFVDCWMFIKS